MHENLVDHLFRHQYGKMVSIYSRVFGLEHLQTIEDAVQDTFISALKTWRTQIPENPEAWLKRAAKNRIIDLFRKIKSDDNRQTQWAHGPASISISELFLDDEIEDSQMRMIFTACHPDLHPTEQIAFALKTISGFSQKEISAALLIKEETIKKRLVRARKAISNKNISFEIPQGKDLHNRLERVLEVVYLIFNEGFHSNKRDVLIRSDLCGEAMRLIQLLLKKEILRKSDTYALAAVISFHASRLESKIDDEGNLINIRDQDRSLWSRDLVKLGSGLMNMAVSLSDNYSTYHYEAAIVFEHLKARKFEDTDWKAIRSWYLKLYSLHPSPIVGLNLAITSLQLGQISETRKILDGINPSDLQHRSYLYYGTIAEMEHHEGNFSEALVNLQKAIDLCNNILEQSHLEKRKARWESQRE